jgi:hypothetical protein
LSVLDRQGDDCRLPLKRGMQEGRRRLVDKVREYLQSSLRTGTPASCTDATESDDYCSSRSRGSVLSKGGFPGAGVFPG